MIFLAMPEVATKPARRSGGRDHHDMVRKMNGDRIATPAPVAADMVRYFDPRGVVMEPFRGDGAIYDLLPSGALWCEIERGVDFFSECRPSDWIITNPPYSMLPLSMRQCFRLANNVVLLIPARNYFAGFGTVCEAHAFGGLRAMRWYGTGSSLGFPMGNGIAALHWERGYRGPINESFCEDAKRQGDLLLETRVPMPAVMQGAAA